jgi:hypothetical protein
LRLRTHGTVSLTDREIKDFETEKDSKVDLIKSFGDNRSAEDILEVGYEGPHSVLSLYMLG